MTKRQISKSREYTVRIEIDVDAASPVEAALEAYELLRHPEALPWICAVRPKQSRGRFTHVDLDQVL
jgi:hypothetical protein